jgi:hypothetical protein
MMTQSNFSYLENEFPILFNIGLSAEYNLHQDPVTSLFKLRQFGERLTDFLFEEHHLEFPYENSFHNRIKTLELDRIIPAQVKDLLNTIKHKGNIAVHQNKGSLQEAEELLFSAFKVGKWFDKMNKIIKTLRSESIDFNDKPSRPQSSRVRFKQIQSTKKRIDKELLKDLKLEDWRECSELFEFEPRFKFITGRLISDQLMITVIQKFPTVKVDTRIGWNWNYGISMKGIRVCNPNLKASSYRRWKKVAICK